MAITKEVNPSTATVFQLMTVTLKITNIGAGNCNDASNSAPVSVNDPLASGLDFSASYGIIQTPAGWWSCSTAISCTSTHIFSPGDSSTLTFQFSVGTAGTYTNCATVSDLNDISPPNNIFNNESCVKFSVNPIVIVPVGVPVCDLAINKTLSPSTVSAGQPVTVTLTVKNVGTGDCNDASNNAPVSVNDPVFANGWTYIGGVTQTPTIWSWSTAPPVTFVSSHVFAPGDSSTITFQFSVGTAGTYTNCATVSSSSEMSLPNNQANNKSCAPFTVVSACDWAITKTMTPTVIPQNQQAVVTITITNLGGACAPPSRWQDNLPASLTANPPISSADWLCGGQAPPNAEVWCNSGSPYTTTGSLPHGYTKTFNLIGVTAVGAPGDYTNCATVSNSNDISPPNNPTNNQSCTQFTIAPPLPACDLTLTKTMTPTPSNKETVTLTVKNLGGPCNPVNHVEDDLPDTLTIVSPPAGSADWVCSSHTSPTAAVWCDSGSPYTSTGPLPSGYTTTLTFTVTSSGCNVCTFILKWGTQGAGDGQFNNPVGVAADSSGNVYVTDSSNSRVEKFDGSGNLILKWGTQGSGNGQFNGPGGIAVDSSGNVYVTDYGNSRVQKFDSSGNFILKWGTQGSGNGQFLYPSWIAVDGSGNVYVNDVGNFRIEKFGSSGNFILTWPIGVMYFASEVAVDSSGNVYLADSGNNRIVKFTSTGTATLTWGCLNSGSGNGCPNGSGDGQFHDPVGVATDSSGNVYVTDEGNSRVEKFDSSGNFLLKWGSYGSGDGQFDLGSKGVAVDSSGDVYVVDLGHNRVEKFGDQNCAFVKSVTASGSNNDGNPINNISCAFSSSAPTSPHCIIATAAYGSDMAAPVQFFRNFRDNEVQKTAIGSAFMQAFNNWYYSWAPGVAQRIAPNEDYKAATRGIIAPLIGSLFVSHALFSTLAPWSPEVAVVSAGLMASSLIGLAYLTPAYAIAWKLSKRRITGRTIYTLAIAGVVLTFIATLTTGTFNVAANLTALTVIETMLLTPAFILRKMQRMLNYGGVR